MNSIAKYADIYYITNENTKFYKTEGGFLGMIKDGNDLGKVSAYRMFPLTSTDRFISIRDKDMKELGIIDDLTDLKDCESVKEELSRRYFVPEITSVLSVKEEFSYTYWDTETTSGHRKFTIFDMNNSLIPLNDFSIMLIDVDGNRYKIPDIRVLGEKALKFIDIWL